MVNIEEVIDRLQKHKGLENDKDLAKTLGLSAADFSNRKRRGTLLSLIFEWAVNENENLDRLFYGGMNRKNGGVVEIPSIQEAGRSYDLERYGEVGVYALAGAGPARDLVANDPIEMICVPKSFCKPSISAIKVRGRSMEPIILDGAYLGIDRDEQWIISGEIYAVWIPYEGAVVKRLYVEPEKIILRSDNRNFPEFSIPNEDGAREMTILGRVKWVLQQF